VSHWDESDSFPDDQAYCAFCGLWIKGIAHGIYVCSRCAIPEPTHPYKSDGARRDPACITCGRYRLDAVHSVRQPDSNESVPSVRR
jgi:hypothetical protein